MESSNWKEILDGNIPFMQENLLLTEIFYGYLIQMNILSDEIVQELREGLQTNEARILRLVSCLKRRDPASFQNFLSVLDSTHNQYVRQRLETLIPVSEYNGRKDINERMDQKDIRIRDLELLVSDLQNRLADTVRAVESEMDRSKHYLEVIQRLSLMEPNSRETTMMIDDDRENAMEELIEEIDCLKEQLDEMESELQHTSQSLQKAKHQLSVALESERNIKRSLGLRENAGQHEVDAKIAEIHSKDKELQKYQEEMERVTEMKEVFSEKIRKLTQEMKKLESEKQRKDMEIKRLRRYKEDNLILQNAKTFISSRTCAKKSEELLLPRINIGSRYPSADARLDSRKLSARQPKILEQSNLLTDTNPKYCVICRKEYYVREACRFHTASLKDGRYPCCGAYSHGVTGTYGCSTIDSHLYVEHTGSEFIFYDQRGGQLNFKEADAKESRILSGR